MNASPLIAALVAAGLVTPQSLHRRTPLLEKLIARMERLETPMPTGKGSEALKRPKTTRLPRGLDGDRISQYERNSPHA